MPPKTDITRLPPLAFYVWQRLDYLKEKGSRLARWVAGHAGLGLTLLRTIRLPILLPAFIPTLSKPLTRSSRWRLLHLIWLRQRQNQKKKTIRRVPVNLTDELDSLAIKNPVSPFLDNMELPDSADAPFSPSQATFVPFRVRKLANKVEAKNTAWSAALSTNKIKLSTIYQTSQIQQPTYLDVEEIKSKLTQVDWPPQLTYLRWWPAPFIARLIPYRVPAKKPSHNIFNVAEAIVWNKEISGTPKDYDQLVDSEVGGNLPDFLPDRGEPAVPGALLEEPSLPPISEVTPSLNEFVLRSMPSKPVVSGKGLGLRLARFIGQRVKSLAVWPASPASLLPLLPQVNPLLETTALEAEAADVPSPVTMTRATPGSVSLSQGRQAGQTETRLTQRQPPPSTSLYYQLSPVIESYDFLEKQGYEPFSPRYEEAHRLALELSPTSIVEPRTGSRSTVGGGSLRAAFEGTAYYGSQRTPELALAPVRPVEAVSSPPPRAEAKAEEITEEATTPDIDAIAGDVYHILKRRLKTEKERAFGSC